MLVILHVPDLDQEIAGSCRNIVRLRGKHDAIDRNWLNCLYRTTRVERSLKDFIIGFKRVYQDDLAILSATSDYFVLNKLLFTRMINVNAVDDSLMRIVQSCRLAGL
jgi:hypothetical protein